MSFMYEVHMYSSKQNKNHCPR